MAATVEQLLWEAAMGGIGEAGRRDALLPGPMLETGPTKSLDWLLKDMHAATNARAPKSLLGMSSFAPRAMASAQQPQSSYRS
mmetsp:Transcript_7563/g.18137  ORF Transcript_7563/g.18137 Transcript_7563/m.18137 type:complete len:83 (-) Transcript_7563:7-255(-)